MASFGIDYVFADYLAGRGFYIYPHPEKGHNRTFRVEAPEGLRGKKAKKWFNKVFWESHTRGRCEDGCCDIVLAMYLPKTIYVRRFDEKED